MSGFPVVNGVEVLRPPPEDYPYELDFDNPRQQKTLEHYMVFGVLGSLAFIALCQRYYTKVWLSKGLQVDDCKWRARILSDLTDWVYFV